MLNARFAVVIICVLTACGQSQSTRPAGVTVTGACDQEFMTSQNQIAEDTQIIKSYVDHHLSDEKIMLQAFMKLDQDCAPFVAKYPNSQCSAYSIGTDKPFTIDSKKIVSLCNYVRQTLIKNPPPSPTATPVPVTRGICSNSFLTQYFLITTQDALAVTQTKPGTPDEAVALKKLATDCTPFIQEFPATVCTVAGSDREIDSRDVQTQCSKAVTSKQNH
jgi:hypothetical protein